MSQAESTTWMITGASAGMGFAYTKAALAHGDNVVAGARHVQAISALTPADRVLAVTLDVTVPRSLDDAVDAAVERFGSVDILVCNAGSAIYGAVEELEHDDFAKLFDLNFFGTLNTIRAVLPLMRTSRKGRILVISSMSGFVGAAGMSAYNASKFAIEGLAEALHDEVGPLGIEVIIVEPGPFKTSFDAAAKVAQRQIDDYVDSAGRIVEMMTHMDWAPGDPDRAATALVDLGHCKNPPRRMIFGEYAWDAVMAKVRDVESDAQRWREVAVSTDRDKSD